MKKEGTGEPRTPDIALDADVKMRELRFEEVPDPKVSFRGSTRRNSVWESRRENLPDEVQEGIVYRTARIRLRIASEIANSGRISEYVEHKGRTPRVRTTPDHQDERP